MSLITADGPTTADQQEAMRISGVLARHYPGHVWGVNVDSRAGVAYVNNFALSMKNAYVLHLGKLANHDEFERKVVAAGGEILERHCVARGAADLDQVAQLATRAVFN